MFIRKILKRKFDQTGNYPVGVYRTWNPRYYASSIRTQMVYEAYPQSQEQVDVIVRKLGLPFSGDLGPVANFEVKLQIGFCPSGEIGFDACCVQACTDSQRQILSYPEL